MSATEFRMTLLELEKRLRLLEDQIRIFRLERNRLAHRLPESTTVSSEKRTEELKTQLLGRLTTLLLRKDYFAANKDLVDFARNHLTIKIPRWQRQSRSEILGIIIENVYSLESDKIRQFYDTASAIKKKEETSGKIGNIFLEWEKTIRQLKFRR